MSGAARVALVTGGSAGLGAEIARQLAGRGWRVWSASRRGTAPVPGIRGLAMDVTDAGAVQAAIAEIRAAEGRLDAVICNAGVNVSAPAEELPLDRARAILETNLWGCIHVIRAALPALRESGGRILAIGSLAGIVSPPGEAYYAASKHALRGFLESLHHEVTPQGVRVALVEPGFIATELARGAAPEGPTLPVYDGLRAQLHRHWRAAIAGGMPAAQAAGAIARLVEARKPPFQTRLGRDAVWVPRLKALLPTPLFLRITARRFGIGG